MRKSVFASRFSLCVLVCLFSGTFCLVHANSQQLPANANGVAGGLRYIEAGQPPVVIHPTVQAAEAAKGAKGSHGGHGGGGSTSNNLAYNGGTGGVGVETAPKIYLVFWGSQWNGNDPSGEAALLQNFFTLIGGTSWQNTVTQYCQGVASGTYFCNGGGQPAGNQTGSFVGAWYDNATAAPTHPTQSQLAAEAVNAATHFGNTANTQFVIATATGNSATGFGTQYCAWHSYTTSSLGNVSYTNLPYITDAGASCGANFNGLGPDAGITIVEGHEMAETITDPYPSSGWIDANGAEIGDKCAWISSGQGASADITLTSSTGTQYTFAVQSLWSNAFNSDAGGCVLSY